MGYTHTYPRVLIHAIILVSGPAATSGYVEFSLGD